jgi:uncharacterized phage-associated protein
MQSEESLPPRVNPKVRSVVLYFAYRNPYPLPSTRLMKLAYLAELRAVEAWGHRLTNADFIHWNYGPFSRDVALAMEGIPELKMEFKQSPRGRGKFFSPAQKKVSVDLTKDEMTMLQSVLDDWQKVDSQSLIAETKRSPPFVWTEFGDPIPFDRYSKFVGRMGKARNGELGKPVAVLESHEDVARFVKEL